MKAYSLGDSEVDVLLPGTARLVFTRQQFFLVLFLRIKLLKNYMYISFLFSFFLLKNHLKSLAKFQLQNIVSSKNYFLCSFEFWL